MYTTVRDMKCQVGASNVHRIQQRTNVQQPWLLCLVVLLARLFTHEKWILLHEQHAQVLIGAQQHTVQGL